MTKRQVVKSRFQSTVILRCVHKFSDVLWKRWDLILLFSVGLG